MLAVFELGVEDLVDLLQLTVMCKPSASGTAKEGRGHRIDEARESAGSDEIVGLSR